MNVEIRTEAAQFPEKEYINGIFLAVWSLDLNRITLGLPIYSSSVYRNLMAECYWSDNCFFSFIVDRLRLQK
jgi:hypothetical protein